MRKCYKCGHPWVDPGQPAVNAICERCQSYLHCCMNCDFYDDYQHNRCREHRADYVHERVGANNCGFFQFRRPPRQELLSEKARQQERRSKALENLNKLFRD